MEDCHCVPWEMNRNDTQYSFELCDSGGNGCFWQSLDNSIANGVEERECHCLEDCENVKYSQFATLKPSGTSECTTRWDGNSLFSIPLVPQEGLILTKMLTPIKNVTDWYSTRNIILNDYSRDLCEQITAKDKASLLIRLEGPTFMTLKRSLRVTFADKLGSIGGTLGLFSGFSLLAIMELIHWICKIINSLIISRK